VPPDLAASGETSEAYLNDLNREILQRVKASGRVYLSHAELSGMLVLRTCTVNFRTTRGDVEALVRTVAEFGEQTDRELRSKAG
jgi:hypothetical protein